VINMSSITAVVGVAERAVYGATKGGIYSLTRAAAIDHVAEGVRVNCIVPGTVRYAVARENHSQSAGS
jgi:NAD(P)-dependent dehydrogenase (short-subunit alcohol dehydrogenase family)